MKVDILVLRNKFDPTCISYIVCETSKETENAIRKIQKIGANDYKLNKDVELPYFFSNLEVS